MIINSLVVGYEYYFKYRKYTETKPIFNMSLRFFSTCLCGLSLTIPGSSTKAHRVTGVFKKVRNISVYQYIVMEVGY